MASSPKTQPAVAIGLLALALGGIAALVLGGGGGDARTTSVQDDGTYAIGIVDKVEMRKDSVDAPAPSQERVEASFDAHYRYNAAGRTVRATISVGADLARSMEGRLYLVMHSTSAPEQSFLDPALPAGVLKTTSGKVEAVETHTIARNGVFSSERSKSCYRYTYQVGGQTRERFEWLGTPTVSNVGKHYAVAYDVRDPDNARLLVGHEALPNLPPPSVESLLARP